MYTDYNYYSDITIEPDVDLMVGGIVIGVLIVYFILLFGIVAFTVIYNWKINKKAGREGWAALIPIYSTIVQFQYLNIPMWMLVFIFIPPGVMVVNIFIAINMAKKFGKDVGFIIGLILLPIIFYPILAFGSSKFNPEIPGIFDDSVVSTNQSKIKEYCKHCGNPKTGKYCSKCGKTNED